MIYILSDYPAKANEDKPLGDSYGLLFWHLLYKVGININDTHIDYLWSDYSDMQLGKADTEKYLTSTGNIVVLLGTSVVKAFGITDPLEKIRGSVIEQDQNYIVCTYHPRDLQSIYRPFADTSIKKSYYCGKDLEKVKTVYDGGWIKPVENFNIVPDYEQWAEFVHNSIRNQTLLATDIEATGLSIEHAQLVVIGFASNESDCIVYPFTDYGGEPYWPEHQREDADNLLRKLLREGKFMFQNGVGYDVPLLRARGYDLPLENFVDDTMILHHVLEAELPHNIGFINSIYGKMKYWKDSFLTKKQHIHFTDQDEMRKYNARDCINLHQVLPPMRQELAKLGLEHIYQKDMESARAVIQMSERGMLFSESQFKKWLEYLETNIGDINDELKAIIDLPVEFNLNSAHHKRWLFYRQPLKNAEKARQVIAEQQVKQYNYQYECPTCGRKKSKKFNDSSPPNYRMVCNHCKESKLFKRTNKERTNVKQKSKHSKKYIEAEKLLIVANVEPFIRIKGYKPKKTKAGELALDKPEMVRMLIYINRRIEAINGLKRQTDEKLKEKAELEKLKHFNLVYQKYTKFEKLQSSFGKYPVWADGRVRPSLLVTGTATGRFSCKNPNLQQVPAGEVGSKVRAIFGAPKNYHLLSVDFGNLEVHIGARIIKDSLLISELEAGNNYHDVNTRAFFGVEKDDPRWNDLRKVAKMLGFARLLYGGSDEGIYAKVQVAFPDFAMSLEEFKASIQRYMDLHPDYVRWVSEYQAKAKEQRYIENANGRRRNLYDDRASISRQALNSPIQGSAADEVSDDLVLLTKALQPYKSGIVMVIHDEFLFEIHEDETEEVYKLIHKIMNRERTINGFKFRIPVDAEFGQYWGVMTGVDLITGEIEEGSKH